MKNNSLIASLATIAALTLTACGGGGGEGAATPAAPVEEPVADTSSTLVQSVAAATYANAEEKAAFDLLNAERQRCGLGLLAQQGQVDVMARGHASYLLINFAGGHYQDMTKPGATGNAPEDRASAAGYKFAVIGDEISSTSGAGANVIAGKGAEGVRNLLSAPYHALGLMSGSRDVGTSVMSSDDVGVTGTHGPRAIVQINLGYQQGFKAQLPDGAAVQTYPCDGTTGTAFELRGETPNPVPGRDLAVDPIGQSVMVQVREGQVLAITSASMKKKDDGSVVALLPTRTNANDMHGSVQAHQAFIMPATSLLPSTDYTVRIEGTNQTTRNGGASGKNPAIKDNATGAFTKTFTFRTGA